MSKDDGATKVPGEDAERAQRKAECMGLYRHYFKWVWEGPTWTNKIRCSTCGEVRVCERTQA